MEDIQTLTREKVKLDEPGLYDVIFLNDNITTTEFVVRVLKQIFGKSQEQAEAIMQKIHNSGSGIVDTRSDWCTFNSSTNLTAQAFVGHYGGYASPYKWGPQNPYRSGIAAVQTSCPLDDNLKPGCIEIIGSDKNDSS